MKAGASEGREEGGMAHEGTHSPCPSQGREEDEEEEDEEGSEMSRDFNRCVPQKAWHSGKLLCCCLDVQESGTMLRQFSCRLALPTLRG